MADAVATLTPQHSERARQHQRRQEVDGTIALSAGGTYPALGVPIGTALAGGS